MGRKKIDPVLLEDIYKHIAERERAITAAMPAKRFVRDFDWKDWEGYHFVDPTGVLDPETFLPPHKAPRREARKRHNHLVSEIPNRMRMFGDLCRAYGLEPEFSFEFLDRLEDFYGENVTTDVRDDFSLDDPWFMFGFDIGLFLGEMMISRHPHLTWRLKTRTPTSPDYQWTVIGGFTKPSWPHQELCYQQLAQSIGEAVLHGDRPETGGHRFVELVEACDGKA